MNRSGFAALILTGLVLVSGAGAVRAAAPQRFDFNTFEYSAQGQDAYGQVPNEEMARRAQAFVDLHYPVGSSADAATVDFRHAGAACRVDRLALGDTVCTYVLPSHGFTSLIGSALWRLDVHRAGTSDQLLGVTVTRTLDAD